MQYREVCFTFNTTFMIHLVLNFVVLSAIYAFISFTWIMCIHAFFCDSLNFSSPKQWSSTIIYHTHTHTHIYICIYIYI